MNEQKVVDMYTKEKMSTYEIAKFYDTYPNKIRRILLKRHVDINSKSEAQKNADLLNWTERIGEWSTYPSQLRGFPKSTKRI